jgi:hypothetical protein
MHSQSQGTEVYSPERPFERCGRSLGSWQSSSKRAQVHKMNALMTKSSVFTSKGPPYFLLGGQGPFHHGLLIDGVEQARRDNLESIAYYFSVVDSKLRT